MRVLIGCRRDGVAYRMVWLNESSQGVYLGVLGGRQDFHLSYHQDGTRHAVVDSEHLNVFKDMPITLNTGVRQLCHASLPIAQDWFTEATAHRGDQKTESLILLDEAQFRECDTLALDVWLLDRDSELEFIRTVGDLVKTKPAFRILAELITTLDNYPDHKLALTLRAAKIRTR